MGYYDDLETRDEGQRAEALAQALPLALSRAKLAPAMARLLRDVEPEAVTDRAALARLPVIRKAELSEAQRKQPPFGGYTTRPAAQFDHIFQSPGPIYEPGRRDGDWWRLGRFLHAAGVGQGDIVQNCFGYHLTPAGMMFEIGRAGRRCGGPARRHRADRTAGARGRRHRHDLPMPARPIILKVILDRADEMGVVLSFTKAVVGGGALFPSLRQMYADRGIVTACNAMPPPIWATSPMRARRWRE